MFPVDPADEWEGFNHAGIEHFRGNPLGSLAREVIQNSLDAPVRVPVIVEFQLHKRPTKELPGIAEFRNAFEACSKAAKNESKKARDFFANASKILVGKHVDVLTISEKNTRGMAGPCKNGNPYFAYMKATGQSKKTGDADLGSYGIGKFAPFAVSNLRTILVSTAYNVNGGVEQLTQAKSILMSHKVGKNTHQQTGYWGIPQGCAPLGGVQHALPQWVQRASSVAELKKSKGTTIHVLGFHVIPKWENILIASVIENFFGAIWSEKLEVVIADTTISKSSIEILFSDESIRSALDGLKSEPDRFDYARAYLKTMTASSEEVFVENTESRDLGNCQVRILVSEDTPKRVAVLRNGMFITDQLDRLKRFADYKEFVAVVECLSEKGNSLLREMEPPKHDDFEPDRLLQSDQQRGRRALKDLGDWVRSMLSRHAKDPVADVTDIDELAAYLADETGNKTAKDGEEIDPWGPINIRAQPLRRKASAPVLIADGPDGGGGANDSDGGELGNGNGPGKGGGQGGGGKANITLVELANVRAVVIGDKKRVVSFTPRTTGKLHLAVYEAGADNDRQLTVKKSDKGSVKNGLINNVTVTGGKRTTIEVELDERFAGAMKVVAHAV